MVLPAPPIPPDGWDTTTLDEALFKRRSVRRFKDGQKEIENHDLSQLLYAGYGVSRERRRVVPSAGAIYPLNLHLVHKNFMGTYTPFLHELIDIRARKGILEELMLLTNVKTLPLICIAISADFSKMQKRYGERGIRYVWMECGHSAQNIQLKAAALGLGSVCVGSFNDGKVKALLGINEDPLYLIPVGYIMEAD